MIVDRNLPGLPAFALTNEGGRASFRGTADIDMATGMPLRDVARLVENHGAAYQRLANGRNRANQVTLSIIPDLPSGFQLRLSSAYTRTEQYSANFTLTGAEPLDSRRWMPIAGVPRWRSVAEFGKVRGRLSMTGVARLDAGIGYTPLISGDINGDGLTSNDRAFVSAEYLASSGVGMRMPDRARRCLAAQSNTIAEVASCSMPVSWSADLAVSLLPDPSALARRGGGRTVYTFRVNNVPALLDRLISRSPRGWGQVANIDPVLASVERFDPSERRFYYTQNPNFGRPMLGASARWAPYFISVDAQIFFGGSVADQQAVRTLKRSNVSRSSAGGVDSVVARLRQTFADPYGLVLSESDSLLLVRSQIEAIEQQQRILNAKVDSLWRVAAVRLVSSAERIGNREAGELLQNTYFEVIRALRAGVQPLRQILGDQQLRRAPADVLALLAGRDPTFYLR